MKANPPDGNCVLFQASSSNGKEFYEIQIIGADVLVLRDFGQCIRSANRAPHTFTQGGFYKLTLTWNGESTKFYINGREIKGFNLMMAEDFYMHRPFIQFDESDNFAVSDIAISPRSDISVEPADRDFVKNCRCPHLSQLLDEKPQEVYNGVSLYGFLNQQARGQVKAYIDLLPAPVAGSIKRIIFVDEGQRLSGAQGLTTSQDTFFLKKGFEPSTFFHEATHIYDLSNKGIFSKEWGSNLMRKEDRPNFAAASTDVNRKNTSVLSHMDWSTASEQIAIFVGSVYDFYLKNKTLSELKTAAFGPRVKEQLDYLLDKGFITSRCMTSSRGKYLNEI